MKMAAIATAITTALVSGSALAAEVYNSDGTSLSVGGRAEFRGDFQGTADGNELGGTMDNKSRFRLNLGGETQITNDLKGIAFYEAEQTVNNSGSNDQNPTFKQRYMYAGLATGGNTVSLVSKMRQQSRFRKCLIRSLHTVVSKKHILKRVMSRLIMR